MPEASIIIVDDGSSDATYRTGAPLADHALRFPRNRGKGAALRAGFETALANNAEIIVTIDADGQHDPEFAPLLVAALADADVVIGARERRRTMPVGRRLTNRLSAAAVAHCIRQPVADAQSGFRAIRRRVAEMIAPAGDRYEFETEFLILAGRRDFRITFVSIPTVYPSAVPSRFRPVRDSVRIVRTLWRFGTGATS